MIWVKKKKKKGFLDNKFHSIKDWIKAFSWGVFIKLISRGRKYIHSRKTTRFFHWLELKWLADLNASAVIM